MKPTVINRVELLRALESVRAGRTPKPTVDQSDYFVFRGGRVMTFDGDIAARAKSPLPTDFTGAAQGNKLLEALSGLAEEEVQVSVVGGQLKFCGWRPDVEKSSGAWVKVRLEANVTLPIDQITPPGSFEPLPELFADAVQIVAECAGSPKGGFVCHVVRLTPTFMEATDNFKMARYSLELDCDAAGFLVKAASLKQVIPLGMTHFSEVEDWVHFRNPSGTFLSLRKYCQDYLDLSAAFAEEGLPITLPKVAADASKLASVYSEEYTDNSDVFVKLKAGRMMVYGVGVSGEAGRVMAVKYDGPEISFAVPPKVLAELADRHPECEVGARFLRVNGGRWVYRTALGVPQTNGKEE